MSEDDVGEVGVAITITDSSAKATFRSRAVSAWDRLFERKATNRTEPLDRERLVHDALTRIELQAYEAAGDRVAKEASNDLDFALRVLRHQSKRTAESILTLDSIETLVRKDLENNPPTAEQLATGPEELSDEFLRRWERSAEIVSTDVAKERWARVLAQEIRQPGSFSSKSLRIIDELDLPTAELFEKLCQSRFKHALPKLLTGNIPTNDFVKLEAAGLVAEVGLGLLSPFSKGSVGETQLSIIGGKTYLVAVDTTHVREVQGFIGKSGNGALGIAIHILTPVGEEIANLFAYDELGCLRRLALALAELLKCDVDLFRRDDDEIATFQRYSIESHSWIPAVAPHGDELEDDSKAP